MPWITQKKWDDVLGRLADLERHFATRRDERGEVVETLADVPLEKRKELKHNLRGSSIHQRIRWMEATDGGRRVT